MNEEPASLLVWSAFLFLAGGVALVAQIRALWRVPARAALPLWEKPSARGLLAFFAIFVFCLLGSGLLCAKLAGAFFPEFDLRENFLVLVPATQTLSLIALLFALKIFPEAFPPKLDAPEEKRERQWLSPKNPFGVPAFFVSTIFVVSLVALLVNALVWFLPENIRSIFEAKQQLVSAWQTADSPWWLTVLCVSAIAVFTPIIEEILFRAGIYRLLATRISPVPAAVASSCVFALMHDAPASYLPLIAMGCVLCFAYEKTGRLAVPVCIHALFNANTLLVIALQQS